MKNPGNLNLLIMAAFVLFSCGQAATKDENGKQPAPVPEQKDSPAAASVITPESVAPEEKPVTRTTAETNSTKTVPKKAVPPASKGSAAPSQTRGLDTEPDNSEILGQIDKYLLSSVQFSANPSGGFSNGVVTITNTLPHARFQKAMLEVSILNGDGSLVRSDYYTVINIESSGGTKIVKLPESKTGNKISVHVVKVKSDELTGGEFVLTGNH